MGHSCRTLLWDTPVGHSCGTLVWDTLIGHSCGTLLRDTLARHSCGPLLRDTLVGHSCGTLQVSKTSVSYETSSKYHTSSLQNERFVRDFLAFRTRLPPKVKRKHPSEHTHHAALPSRFAIPAPPNNTRPHANPNVYHNSQPHDSLRLPRIFPRPHV